VKSLKMGTEGETKANNNAIEKKYDDDGGWAEFLWNTKTKQFCGRTGASWIKIFVFYCVFYAALAAFSWLCYYLFATMTLTPDRPRWILDSSIIGTNPGIGFRPMPDQDTNAGSSLIWYKRANDKDAALWYDQLTNYTDAIENPEKVDGLQVCSYENGLKATDTKSCRVDIKEFGGACTKANKFGYTTGEPCILIKLNRIFGWKPEPLGINDKGEFDAAQLKEDLDSRPQMPKDLREHIEQKAKEANPESKLDTVWISCVGENVGDQENLGTVNYFPRPGIAGYYFPYSNQPGYQSPFIFVQLQKPKSNVLINIECRSWSRNIVYDKQDRLGSVHFEILVD
jgi:sodium/potassium-transporting ATPase subunit beta